MRRGSFALRIVFFLATNLAVVLVLAIVLRLLGVDTLLNQSGTGIGYGSLLVFSVVIGFAGAFISLALSKWMAKHFTGAQVIEEPRTETEEWLVATVRRLAAQVHIGMPEVAIYPSPDLNAFATGARRNHALVAVSAGILRAMPRDELEAVLGHEISHVANGDMVTMTLLQGVLNTFVVFLSRVIGYVVDRAVFRTERGRGPGFWITTIVCQLLLGILASILVAWYSRRRELRADGGSARLMGPAPMIGALQTLARAHDESQLPQSMRAFGIRGGGRQGFMRLFMSHPSIEVRIAALQRNG